MEYRTRADGLLEPPKMAARAAAIAFLRIWIGIMWLFEVTVGHNWKIGGLASLPHPGWLGERAGDSVVEAAETAIADGTWAWAAWLLETVIIPNAALFGYVTIGLQVALGLALIVGVAVRPLAALAIIADLSIFMLGNSRIPPFFTAAHIFVLVSGAGAYYGLDGLLLNKTRDARKGAARALHWVLELPLLKPAYLPHATAVAAFGALFFFLSMPGRETTRMAYVGMDLAALLALVALGLYLARRVPDRLTILASGLRIFVGYKLLHEIWARTVPGVNALPGFADAEAQSEVFQTVVDNHWALFSSLIDTIVLSNMGFWVVVFGAAQLVIGVMLLVGYRTRVASLAGLAFLGLMIVLGLTRYAPVVFGLLIPVLALDGGRFWSLDSVRKPDAEPRHGLPIPSKAIYPLIMLAAINAVAAAITAFSLGIEPGDYVGSLPSMVTAFVAIFSGLLAFVGWLQLHPTLDHSGEVVVDRDDRPRPART